MPWSEVLFHIEYIFYRFSALGPHTRIIYMKQMNNEHTHKHYGILICQSHSEMRYTGLLPHIAHFRKKMNCRAIWNI